MDKIEGGRFLGWGWTEYGAPNEVAAAHCIGLDTTFAYTVFEFETGRTKHIIQCPLRIN